ncbi:WD-40 repeat protein [Reticulomyxa filosa]|uniref:WD-40 repeat protein n=1 Tax=Reticulomyxa filosa TaxID=46433 RepID=X6MZZ8_RETFI|nr:WD-40 repeat protein [Reticulomyxa filosa]|eukprot:ETO19228.1 WD-40 repeat protein [Reticulomyxa filosa]
MKKCLNFLFKINERDYQKDFVQSCLIKKRKTSSKLSTSNCTFIQPVFQKTVVQLFYHYLVSSVVKIKIELVFKNELNFFKSVQKGLSFFHFFKKFAFFFLKKNMRKIDQKQNLTNSTPFRGLKDSSTPLAKVEQSQTVATSSPFQSLKDLAIRFWQSQCVLHKHEILICGGYEKRDCYSYHTLKDEYKFVCSYPKNVILNGHCVVKLVDNSKDNDEITLLSFGGLYKHAFVMKYVSVWSNDDDNNNEINKLNYCNQWTPFTDDCNHPIHIGKDKDNYQGVRAVIGGSNNHLLFITYSKNNIDVFHLNKSKCIKHDTLPTNDYIRYHCFVSKSENGQKMTKTNEEKNKGKKKLNNEMVLFCEKTGLSIIYDEDSNTFQFYKLRVCKDISSFNQYAYVFINDAILFFGGYGWEDGKYIASKAVCKYSIQENTWITFEHTLPIPLYDCFGILNEDNNYIHIIGGRNDRIISISTNMKTKVNVWRDASQLSKNEIKVAIQYWIRILKIKLGWINDFNKITIKYIKGFQLLAVLQAHDNIVSSVIFSADGRKIVSASHDRTVRVWDVESGKQLQIFRGHDNRVFAARFSPDGNIVVSCSGDGTIRLWDVNTGTEVMKLKSDTNRIWDVNFSPDGKYVVSGLQDNTIRLWDVHSGIEIKQFLGHSKSVLSTQFSPDGKMVVSSSYDKTINLWDVESGEILKQFKGHSDCVTRAKFSPDGQCIISCSFDDTVQIWYITTGKSKILKGHLNHVNDVKYFPDGHTIVLCSSGNRIRLWNVKTGKEIQKLEGNSNSVIVKFKFGDYKIKHNFFKDTRYEYTTCFFVHVSSDNFLKIIASESSFIWINFVHKCLSLLII